MISPQELLSGVFSPIRGYCYHTALVTLYWLMRSTNFGIHWLNLALMMCLRACVIATKKKRRFVSIFCWIRYIKVSSPEPRPIKIFVKNISMDLRVRVIIILLMFCLEIHRQSDVLRDHCVGEKYSLFSQALFWMYNNKLSLWMQILNNSIRCRVQSWHLDACQWDCLVRMSPSVELPQLWNRAFS